MDVQSVWIKFTDDNYQVDATVTPSEKLNDDGQVTFNPSLTIMRPGYDKPDHKVRAASIYTDPVQALLEASQWALQTANAFKRLDFGDNYTNVPAITALTSTPN